MASSNGASTQDNLNPRSQQGKESDHSRQEVEIFPKYIMFCQKRESLASILIGKERAFANYR